MRIQLKNEAPECPCGPLARNTPGEPHRLWWCILLRWWNHRFSGFCSCLSWWVLSPGPVSSPFSCDICSIEQMCILNRLLGPTSPSNRAPFLFHSTSLCQGGRWVSRAVHFIYLNSKSFEQKDSSQSQRQPAGGATAGRRCCPDALEDLRAHSVFEGFLFLSLLEVIVTSSATKIDNACCPVFLEPFDFPLEFKFQCLAFNELVRPHRPHCPCKSPHFLHKDLGLPWGIIVPLTETS